MMRLAAAAVLAMGLQAQAVLVVNPTVLDADWETGDWTSGYTEFSQARANFQFKDTGGSSYGFTEDYNDRVDWQTYYATNEFARSGDFSVKFYSNPQSQDPQPYRTEIAYFGDLTFDQGDGLYYSASYRPGAFTGPKTWTTVISQWKIAGAGRPAFSLGLSNDGNHNLSLARAYGDGTSVEQTPLGTLPLEEWTDFVFYFKWSSSSDGVAKVWKDGELIHDFTGITWYDGSRTLGYLQLGMYTQLEWGERTMHIDNVRIGDSMFINEAPVFSSDPFNTANGSENVAYSGTIAGSATDPEGSPLTYAKTAGPAWLQVAADGTLSGTPGSGDVGLNVFAVRVADSDFGEGTATLEVTVDATFDTQAPTPAPAPIWRCVKNDRERQSACDSTLVCSGTDDNVCGQGRQCESFSCEDAGPSTTPAPAPVNGPCPSDPGSLGRGADCTDSCECTSSKCKGNNKCA